MIRTDLRYRKASPRQVDYAAYLINNCGRIEDFEKYCTDSQVDRSKLAGISADAINRVIRRAKADV